jgi:hypothetical protein
MNITTLLSTLDKYRKLQNPYWILGDIFKALLSEPLNLPHDYDVYSLFRFTDFTVHVVYEVPAVDEDICQLYVVCDDLEPIFFYGLHGYGEDARGEITVIRPSWVSELVQRACIRYAEGCAEAYRNKVEKQTLDTAASISSLGGRKYIAFVNDTIFVAQKAAGNPFARLLEAPYQILVRTEAGLEPVPRPNSVSTLPEADRRGHYTVQTKAGELVVPRSRLVFQTMENEKDREDIIRLMSAEGDWKWDSKHSRPETRKLALLVRKPLEWQYLKMEVTFDRDELVQSFIEKYPADTLQPGTLAADTHIGINAVKVWH